jgi:hypothetical protein
MENENTSSNPMQQHSAFFNNDETLANLFQSYEWSYANNDSFSLPQSQAGPSSAMIGNIIPGGGQQQDDLDSWLMADLSGLTGEGQAGAGSVSTEKQQINPSFAQSLISSQLQANNNFNIGLIPPQQQQLSFPSNNILPPGVDQAAIQQYLKSIGASTLVEKRAATSTKTKRKSPASASSKSNKRKPAVKKDSPAPPSEGEEESDSNASGPESSTQTAASASEGPLDKRKKNTIASQKFRARKKQRDAEMAQKVAQQEVIIKDLQDKIKQQDMELSFLKKVVAGMSNGSGVLSALSS